VVEAPQTQARHKSGADAIVRVHTPQVASLILRIPSVARHFSEYDNLQTATSAHLRDGAASVPHLASICSPGSPPVDSHALKRQRPRSWWGRQFCLRAGCHPAGCPQGPPQAPAPSQAYTPLLRSTVAAHRLWSMDADRNVPLFLGHVSRGNSRVSVVLSSVSIGDNLRVLPTSSHRT
jgi:hypothetical protein